MDTGATTNSGIHDLLRSGLLALDMGDGKEAESLFRAVLAVDPSHPAAYQGLGKALLDQLRLPEAEFVLQESIAHDPQPALAQYHLGLCRLLMGNYRKGWQGWERRLAVPAFGHRQLAVPRWAGGAPPGSRLLVLAEQGYGDTIQFSRFLPKVAAEFAASITFACPTPLMDLYQPWTRNPGITLADHFSMDALSSIDAYVSIGSLGAIFDVRVEQLPGPLPELEIDPEKLSRWRAAYTNGRPAVALCWAGRPTHPQDRLRSISPEQLLPLREKGDLQLIGLQRPPCQLAPPPGLLDLDWGNDIHDFSDLAAMMAAVDVVVTVDTSIAHLAGTLRRPVFLMLPFSPDWRWLLDRDDSPWYPTLRLFRQPRPGDWTSVVSQVGNSLLEFALR